MDQILRLHSANPLSLSDVTRIVGDLDLGRSGVVGGEPMRGKMHPGKKGSHKMTFSNAEEFVSVLRLVSGVGVESVTDNEEGEKDLESSKPEPSPPSAFCYKHLPQIVVEEYSDDSPCADWSNDVPCELWQPLSSSDLCCPDFDFYERCVPEDVNCSTVKEEEGICCGKPDSGNTQELCEDGFDHPGINGDRVGGNTLEEQGVENNSFALDNNDAIESVITGNESAEGKASSDQEIVAVIGTKISKEGQKSVSPPSPNSNEAERNSAECEGSIDDKQIRGMGRIDEVEEEEAVTKLSDFVGKQQRPSSSSTASGQCSTSHPRAQHQGAKRINLKFEIIAAAKTEQGKTSSSKFHKASKEGESLKNDPLSVCNEKKLEADSQSPDADSDSDVPSVIEVKPASESSQENFSTGMDKPDKSTKTLVLRYKPNGKAHSPSPVEQVLKIDADREDRKDTNEDLRNIHSEQLEAVDHLSGQVSGKDTLEVLTDDNEDGRSISPAPCAVDHLSGLDRLTRPSDVGNVPSVGGGEDIKPAGPVKNSSGTAASGTTKGKDTTLSSTDRSRQGGELDRSTASCSESDTASPGTLQDGENEGKGSPAQIFVEDHGDEEVEMGGVKVSHSTPLHRTEPFTDVSQEQSIEGSFQHRVGVDTSQSELHTGIKSGGAKNISMVSSAVLETFAADVQAIYGNAAQMDSPTQDSCLSQATSQNCQGLALDVEDQYHLEEEVLGDPTDGVDVSEISPQDISGAKLEGDTPVPHNSTKAMSVDNSGVIENFASTVQAIYSSSQHNQTLEADAPKALDLRTDIGHDTPLTIGETIDLCVGGELKPFSNQKTIQLFHGEHIVQPSDTEDSAEESEANEQKDPQAVESVSTTTQTDNHPGQENTMGTGLVVRHRKLQRLVGSARAGPSTTLLSNIHVGLPSSILEVDIALQKTTFTSPPSQSGREELGDAIEENGTPESEVQTTSGEDSTETGNAVQLSDMRFTDMISYAMGCFDLIFWFCMALAIVVFEACRRGF